MIHSLTPESEIKDQARARISSSLMRLRAFSPFFGTLALFAKHSISTSIPTAATDGITILFNPEFMDTLDDRELDAVMLHEVLHAALQHNKRRSNYDPGLWNIAADIVVNGVVGKQEWVRLPDYAVTDKSLAHHSVEEVYEVLSKKSTKPFPDSPLQGDIIRENPDSVDIASSAEKVAAYWKDALNRAATIERIRGNGVLPAELDRLVENINSPQINWQQALWRFLVVSPNDYTGFDRRQISRGIYTEELTGQTVSAKICVDTSGSIACEELEQFLGELTEIVRSYPSIDAEIFYSDTQLYGPYPLTEEVASPSVKGGGGTSFIDFFEAVKKCDSGEDTLCIYLTDGYGEFPPDPNYPVLWVVTPGGIADERFPFGEVARLSIEN